MLLILFLLLIFAALFVVIYALARQQKSKPELPKVDYPFDYIGLIAFVEKADDAYILTHATLDIMPFSKFASSKASNELIEFLYRNPPKMFGSKKHRKRSWEVESYKGDSIFLKKTITHRQVKVKRGIKIKLGDDLTEYWEIAVRPNGFRVEAVQSDSDFEKEV
ncbi:MULTISPECIES: hypothetical protein [unclassified Paenibacillus]|uniref:hypothetical protein n=1 Tax=unclassified Paenibacillus TaxID=185978 RepID=UPI0036D3B371